MGVNHDGFIPQLNEVRNEVDLGAKQIRSVTSK